MARDKALTDEEIETYYMLILEYGQDKGGMAYVNKKLQEMLHPDKTIAEIRGHFRRANPNDADCTPERKIKFTRRTADLQDLLYATDLLQLKSKLEQMEGKDFFDVFLAIHKTIAANVREEIEIDALIGLLHANRDLLHANEED